MTKDTALLTICIPSYNRPETLEVILKGFEIQNTPRVKIIVADDNSPDDGAIKQMIQPYLSRMSNLTYIRNPENLGYSANVLSLYEMADTEYVWFFCDDDVPLENSIATVIESIEELKPVVAIFNHKQFDPYENYIEAGVPETKIYTKIEDIHNYQELQRTTFLSVLVLKKLPIDLLTLKSRPYTDNVFIQLTLTLMLLSEECVFCQISRPILHRNVGYNYGSFFKFYILDHLKAANIVTHKFDNTKFLDWSVKHLPVSFNLYLSQKLGLYAYRKSPTFKSLKEVFKYWGIYSIFVLLIPIVSFFIPALLLKTIFFMMLWKDHGFVRAKYLYAKNINRAYNDKRKTGFINYR